MFIGSEALRSGRLTRGGLRWNYVAIHPDIYIEKGLRRTLEVNTRAAALWVPDGVVTGRAAAALHGAGFVDDDVAVEIIGRSRRPRNGVVVREERIHADEITCVNGIPVTTPVRTALDLARHLPRVRAVEHLDALAAATGVSAQSVLDLAARYPGARGIRRARHTMPLVDAGSQSPRESWLRMLLIDSGCPRPETQIMVSDGMSTAFIDMGWRDLRIGLEYDGDQHHSDRNQYVKDIGRQEMLANLDWLIIRVVREHSRAFIAARVREAFQHRLAKPAPGSWNGP